MKDALLENSTAILTVEKEKLGAGGTSKKIKPPSFLRQILFSRNTEKNKTMFRPKTMLECAMAMQTGAEVAIGAYEGQITAIVKGSDSGREWMITISTSDATEEVMFRE